MGFLLPEDFSFSTRDLPEVHPLSSFASGAQAKPEVAPQSFCEWRSQLGSLESAVLSEVLPPFRSSTFFAEFVEPGSPLGASQQLPACFLSSSDRRLGCRSSHGRRLGGGAF